MNELFIDFLTILLPTYFFFYMAITLIDRNSKSMLNRVAALLMFAFLFYFLGEYIKTSLLPHYQMQIVLYGNGPMLLLVICSLVHLCVLMGGPTTSSLKRWLPLVYATPYCLSIVFLTTKDHRVLYNADVTDGRSPLDPLYLVVTVCFVAGYILLSVVILVISWYRAKDAKRRKILRSMLLGLFSLFAWFVLVTLLLQSEFLTSRNAMILYFIGYLVWSVSLRRLIGKYSLMPDYRKLFHVLFKSAPTAILLLDQKGAIREMNPRAQEWFEGVPTDDILSCCEFDDKLSLADKLPMFLQQQEIEAQWEARMFNPNNGYHLDLIMGLDSIEEADEELFVIHLTDVTSLKDTERKLLESEQSYKYLAHHDPLTGLYNRAAIQEQLQQKIADRERFALILIDLDHFKPINDTYGHLVGDFYLKHIAQILKNHEQPGDLIGRIGGDEFVLILSRVDERSDCAQAVKSRLSLLYTSPYKHEGVEIPVSFSAGVSVYPRDASDVTTLLKIADEAMYSMKRSGRNRSTFYESE